MLTGLEKKYCQSLKEYVDKNLSCEKGYISKLAEKIGISQGQLSNIIAGRKGTDEETRRKIAEIIGVEYDVMIGLKIKNNKPTNPDGKVYELPVVYKPPPIDNKLAKLHDSLDIIYKHGDDDLKSAIEMNLISFRKTVENQQEMLSMKEEIETLKKTIKHGT